jgi:hypothetical protein
VKAWQDNSGQHSRLSVHGHSHGFFPVLFRWSDCPIVPSLPSVQWHSPNGAPAAREPPRRALSAFTTHCTSGYSVIRSRVCSVIWGHLPVTPVTLQSAAASKIWLGTRASGGPIRAHRKARKPGCAHPALKPSGQRVVSLQDRCSMLICLCFSNAMLILFLRRYPNRLRGIAG